VQQHKQSRKSHSKQADKSNPNTQEIPGIFTQNSQHELLYDQNSKKPNKNLRKDAIFKLEINHWRNSKRNGHKIIIPKTHTKHRHTYTQRECERLARVHDDIFKQTAEEKISTQRTFEGGGEKRERRVSKGIK
jgi:hypothetical protein